MIKNPFATHGQPAYDLQRKDLWQIDLTSVARYLSTTSVIGYVPVDQNTLTRVENLYTARSISIPPRRVKAREIVRGSKPQNFPGLLEPLEPVRVEVTHEALPSGEYVSPSYGLFYAWRELARAGRSDSNDGGAPDVALDPVNFKPVYRFDVIVRMLTGVQDGSNLAAGAEYRLKSCWVRSLQLGQIDKAGAGTPHMFTAQLQPLDIEEI